MTCTKRKIYFVDGFELKLHLSTMLKSTNLLKVVLTISIKYIKAVTTLNNNISIT